MTIAQGEVKRKIGQSIKGGGEFIGNKGQEKNKEKSMHGIQV